VAEEVVEKFRPTSGRITGLIALALVAAVVAIGLLDRDQGYSPTVVWGALVIGVLVWSAMLRPRLWATTSHLVMRNMLSTVSIPLAAVEQVLVRQVVAVRAGDQRYVCPAVGKSWRQAIRSDKPAKPGAAVPYAAFVEDRLHQLTEDARAREGVALLSDEQLALADGVRRQWAWPEIAALVVTCAGLVAALAL
jgi:hypothetical protein